jgi:hypothetical protein
MPRKRKKERIYLVESDRHLKGTWWRCTSHALTQDPIHLGGKTYCPEFDCEQEAELVHSSIHDNDDKKRGWNDIAV